MRAVVIEKYGGIENLTQKTLTDPQPGPGEVLVRVRAAGINPVDWKMRRGELRVVQPLKFPAVLGCDVAGVVECAGAGVTRFRPGDEVFGMTRPAEGGAYAELVRVPASQLCRKPENLSFEAAAAVPLAGLTAYQALRDFGRIRGMMRVLIHGVSGGVGLFALQIARIHGAKVTGVCSERNADFIRGMQADEVIDYRKRDPFAGEPRYDLVFDTIGSANPVKALPVLKPGGTFVSTLPSARLLWRHFMTNAWSRRRAYFVSVKPSGKDLEDLARWLEAGKMIVEVEASYPFSEIRSAHARSETGRVRGKLVLSVSA